MEIIRPFPGTRFDAERQLLRFFRPGGLVQFVHLWPKPWALEKLPASRSYRHFRPAFLRLAGHDSIGENPRADARELSRVRISSEEELALIVRHDGGGLSYVEWEERSALQAALAAVPAGVRELISRNYETRHYHLLSLIARVPGSGDVAAEAPGLAFCMANSWLFRKCTQPFRAMRELLRGSPKTVLAWLGFGKEAWNIFRKIDSRHMSPVSYLYLRQAMRNKAMLRKLAFQPAITPLLTRIITDPVLAPHAGYNFLLECGQRSEAGETLREEGSLFRDTLEMAEGANAAACRTLVFNSFAHLRRIHDELVEGASKYRPANYLPVLPPPPYAGVNVPDVISIAPLTTSKEVIDWNNNVMGKVCLETVYLRRVAESGGNAFLYALSFPETGAVYIERGASGKRFRVMEVRGAGNSPVRPATRKAVEWFFRKSQGKDFTDTENL